LVIGLVLFLLIRLFLTWGRSDILTGQVGNFASQTVSRALEAGGQVLGTCLDQAPIDPKIKETVIKSGSVFSSDNQEKPLEKLSPEEIGEAVKALPANQAKEIKKEIFGDFCQEILDD